jgi:hypothetical protein
VDALSLLLRARLRRWRGWLSLSLLAALLSGLALAAASAGHRTATAFPQFVAAHAYDALVISAAPMPALAKLPGVASATLMHQFAAGTPACACARPINPAYFTLAAVAPADLPRMVKLVAGRMPSQNAPDEVLASFRLEQDAGVGVGTVIRVPLYTAAQQSAYSNGAAVTPAAGAVTLRVVGIEAAEAEFPFATTPSYTVYTTAAFARLWAGRTARFAFYFVRLHGGAPAFPRFQARVRAIGAFSVSDMDTAAGSIGTAIWPQVMGWWLLAGLTALAGMVVLAQALARQAEAGAEPYGTYRALGATWRQLAAVGMIATLLVAVAGAGIGTALAFLLSPLTPVGLARVAELSTGFTFDTAVLAPGAGVAVLVVLADGARRVGARRGGAVGGGGVRCQPRASDQHAHPLRAAVRRVVLAERLGERGQRGPVLGARDHPGARSGYNGYRHRRRWRHDRRAGYQRGAGRGAPRSARLGPVRRLHRVRGGPRRGGLGPGRARGGNDRGREPDRDRAGGRRRADPAGRPAASRVSRVTR